MDRLRKILPVVAVSSTVLTFLPLIFAPPRMPPEQWMAVFATVAIASVGALYWTEREARRYAEASLAAARPSAASRARLGELMTEGRGLRKAAAETLTAPKADLDAPGDDRVATTKKAMNEWAETVVAYLDQTQPGWSSVFLDDSWHGTQFSGGVYEYRSNAANWYERRLGKLGELLLRLGA